MTFGKLDAGKPPVRFDEGRDWDRKLPTTVCLTPLSQSRLLYSADNGSIRYGEALDCADAASSGGRPVVTFTANLVEDQRADRHANRDDGEAQIITAGGILGDAEGAGAQE